MKYVVNKNKQLCSFLIFFGLAFFLLPGCDTKKTTKVSIDGAVENSLHLSFEDIQAMPEFHINAVAGLEEKQTPTGDEALVDVADYGGVLLRDLLKKAGMTYKMKFEPGVFFRVKGSHNEEVVFSFGEIFYSSIGRSTLLAYHKNGKSTGRLELVVSNDIRNGRRISDVAEIIVERVDIAMKVYDEREKGIVQPPTTQLEVLDRKTGESRTVSLEDLTQLPKLEIIDKVQVGDCEGFHGIYDYKGTALRALFENMGLISFPLSYDRYIAVTSENGFCATYSFGELFNSRLENNIVIAYSKGGSMLGEDEGFAMMVAVEDNTGGRSVKRISDIFIY